MDREGVFVSSFTVHMYLQSQMAARLQCMDCQKQ